MPCQPLTKARDIKESTPHIGGWVAIKTFINFMCNI